jgi:hypothetical protein
MFGRPRMLVTIAAFALTMPAAAQAPTPAMTGFDGKYIGTATISGGRATACRTITSVDMTITGGQVVIHQSNFNGGTAIFRGSVNAGGEYRHTVGLTHHRVMWGRPLILCPEPSMTTYSQVGPYMEFGAIGASKWSRAPRRRCRSTGSISGYREGHRRRRAPRAPSVRRAAFRIR